MKYICIDGKKIKLSAWQRSENYINLFNYNVYDLIDGRITHTIFGTSFYDIKFKIIRYDEIIDVSYNKYNRLWYKIECRQELRNLNKHFDKQIYYTLKEAKKAVDDIIKRYNKLAAFS